MRYKFSENEDVAHIDNLEQKMTIKEIKYAHLLVEGKQKRKIKGVVCYWFFEGKYQEQTFHTERVVAWPFAKMGKDAARQWLKDMGAKSFQS